jgi:hypothetical protein
LEADKNLDSTAIIENIKKITSSEEYKKTFLFAQNASSMSELLCKFNLNDIIPITPEYIEKTDNLVKTYEGVGFVIGSYVKYLYETLSEHHKFCGFDIKKLEAVRRMYQSTATVFNPDGYPAERVKIYKYGLIAVSILCVMIIIAVSSTSCNCKITKKK